MLRNIIALTLAASITAHPVKAAEPMRPAPQQCTAGFLGWDDLLFGFAFYLGARAVYNIFKTTKEGVAAKTEAESLKVELEKWKELNRDTAKNCHLSNY
jgi:hypothetical protein